MSETNLETTSASGALVSRCEQLVEHGPHALDSETKCPGMPSLPIGRRAKTSRGRDTQIAACEGAMSLAEDLLGRNDLTPSLRAALTDCAVWNRLTAVANGAFFYARQPRSAAERDSAERDSAEPAKVSDGNS